MIKLYDTNGAIMGGYEAENRRIEREISLPPVFSFEVHKDLSGPFYLDGLTKSEIGSYLIKEKKKSGDYYSFVCKPDFSALQTDLITRAFITVTAAEMMADILTGTGWIHEITGSIQRTATLTESTRYDSIYTIADAFKYEIYFDIVNKKIIMGETVGLPLGQIYIHNDVNLINLNLSADSYDIYTRIIPRGNNGVGIESVNGGIPYIDNFQYTNRVKPFIWHDERYTDLISLKNDAADILDEISKPYQSYEISVVNLYRIDPGQWGFLKYQTGDFIDLVSTDDSIDTEQRIIKTLTYLDKMGDNDTVTIANLNRDYTTETKETVRQATETIRAELKLLDDGIAARVQTHINDVLDESDFATNAATAAAITAQLAPLQLAITGNETAIADAQAAIDANDTQALKNLMATLELSYTNLNNQINALDPTDEIIAAQGPNTTNYTALVNIYNSAIADGEITPAEWTQYENALSAYKITSADLERIVVSTLNANIGLLDSEITDVKLLITPDAIIQKVTSTQTWIDAISSIPDADAIGAIIETKIIEYDTTQTQDDEAFQRAITESISENAELIEKRTRYFTETMAGLEIGLSTSPFTTLISNEKMSFLESGNIVAYIRYNQMVIQNVIAKKSLQMGEHKFESYAGNLTIARWTGPFVES